jgi:asparagine synthase (glutamine-hydrolysing)
MPEAAHEQQPFTLDGVTITCDGRVDARDELIAQLRSAGREVSAATPDSALILHAYLAWGVDCVQHFIGDFSFGVWDARHGRLFAARDRFGLRPLYYARVGQAFIFGNEFGPLRLHPAVRSALDDSAIAGFLVLGWHLWDQKTATAFADIRRVPAAHRLIADAAGVRVERYWTMPTDEPMLRYRTEGEYLDHFRETFKAAVKDRLRPKRVLVSLSGGLDSSNVLAMAAHLVQSGEVSAELNAMTVVYDRIHPDTEAFYVGLTTRKLKIPHTYFVADSYRLGEPMTNLAEPHEVFQSGYQVAMFTQAAMLGDVTLTGQGADECFFWDPIYEVLRRLPPAQALDLYLWQWRSTGKRPPLTGLQRYLNPRQWFKGRKTMPYKFPVWLNPDLTERLNLRQRFDNLATHYYHYPHPLHPAAYRALHTPDWATGGELLGGLSFRPPVTTSPFLDVRVAQLCMRLPPRPWFEYKHMLRVFQADRLPSDVLKRWKTPLGSIVGSVLYVSDPQWYNGWQPTPALAPYVRREAVPPLVPEAWQEAYVNLRPLLLNSWLANMHKP